jgi:hypothetical protein
MTVAPFRSLDTHGGHFVFRGHRLFVATLTGKLVQPDLTGVKRGEKPALPETGVDVQRDFHRAVTAGDADGSAISKTQAGGVGG